MTTTTARLSLLCEPRILTILSLSVYVSQSPVSAKAAIVYEMYFGSLEEGKLRIPLSIPSINV